MTNNKKSPFLLRAVIVVVALAVGAGLNVYFLRGAHDDRQPKQESPQRETAKAPSEQEASNALPSRDFNVASPFKGSGAGAKPGEVQPAKPAEGAQPAQIGEAAKDAAAPARQGASAEQAASATNQTPAPAAEAAAPANTEEGQKDKDLGQAAPAAAGAGQPQPGPQAEAQPEVQPQAQPAGQAPESASVEQAAPEKPLTKAELRAKAKAEAEEKAKARAEARAKAKAEAVEKAKAAAEEKAAKAQAEAQRKAEAKAQAKAEAEAKAEKAKAEAEEKAKARAEARAKAKAEAAEKAKAAAPGEDASAKADGQAGQSRGAAVPVVANKLMTLKAEETANAFILTLQCDKPVDKVAHFATPNPARMVFDLSGAWRVLTEMTTTVNGGLVERVRLGLHPDKLRLVLDFTDKELQQYPAPTVEQRENAVVIRLAKVKG